MNKLSMLLFLAVFFLSATTSVLSQSKLAIPEPDFDFGFVPQHSKISHVFWLHSTGTDSLNIIKVSPG
nr:hypothetical protein [candidate division Zixibacteria bacterium]